MKLTEAQKTLLLAEYYMDKLNDEAEKLSSISLSDKKIMEFIKELLPVPENTGDTQARNIDLLRTKKLKPSPTLASLPKNKQKRNCPYLPNLKQSDIIASWKKKSKQSPMPVFPQKNRQKRN